MMKEYTIRISQSIDEKLKLISKRNKLTEENNHIESCFYYFLGIHDKINSSNLNKKILTGDKLK